MLEEMYLTVLWSKVIDHSRVNHLVKTFLGSLAAAMVEASSLRSALGRSSKTYSMSLSLSLFTIGRIHPSSRRALAPPALPKSHILQKGQVYRDEIYSLHVVG